MKQGNFGNVCDTENFGDPVVLYDTFEDRWVITDFAFTLDGGNNVINPMPYPPYAGLLKYTDFGLGVRALQDYYAGIAAGSV